LIELRCEDEIQNFVEGEIMSSRSNSLPNYTNPITPEEQTQHSQAEENFFIDKYF
jgi:hypothetical protein